MRELIGKGTFTKAYQVGPNEVEIVSTCPAKECYALFSQGNSFAPVIEAHDYENDTFKMPLYPKVKAPKRQLNAESYKVYQTLRKIHLSGIGGYQNFCRKIDDTDLPEETKEEIVNLASDVCNAIDCRDLGFEISPRNISVTAEGDLVLMDCFFCKKLLKKVHGW